MKDNKHIIPEPLRMFGRGAARTAVITGVMLLLLVFAVVTAFYWLNKDNTITLSHSGRIDITPMQIRSIERIGEWEFLSVSDEELIDTIRHGFFGDSQLVRIYHGTLRLGVNLHEAKPGWITANEDTILVTLPPIKLLSNDFIDEARTRSFYENGSWTEDSRDALYRKAYATMKKRCLNNRNIVSAEQNAITQFDNLLRAMGYNFVKIRFENQQGTEKDE